MSENVAAIRKQLVVKPSGWSGMLDHFARVARDDDPLP